MGEDEYDEEEADEAAREEWESELAKTRSQGVSHGGARSSDGGMGRERFIDGMFELVDLYVPSLTADDYSEFLYDLSDEVFAHLKTNKRAGRIPFPPSDRDTPTSTAPYPTGGSSQGPAVEAAEAGHLEDAGVPPGGSVAPDGTILGPDGQPVLGADGRPVRAKHAARGQRQVGRMGDPQIPPGGSVAADGTILGADGLPIKGPDGLPMKAVAVAASPLLDATIPSVEGVGLGEDGLSGMYWKLEAAGPPTTGFELRNNRLSKSLALKHKELEASGETAVAFSDEEVDAFNLAERILPEHYVVSSSGAYFVPTIGPPGAKRGKDGNIMQMQRERKRAARDSHTLPSLPYPMLCPPSSTPASLYV